MGFWQQRALSQSGSVLFYDDPLAAWLAPNPASKCRSLLPPVMHIAKLQIGVVPVCSFYLLRTPSTAVDRSRTLS